MNEVVKRRLVGAATLILFGLVIPASFVWWARPNVAPESVSVRVYEITETGRAVPAAANDSPPEPAPRDVPEPKQTAEPDTAAAVDESESDSDARMPEEGAWVVQVGSFTREENALSTVRKLADRYPAYTHQGEVDGRRFYRVRMGPYGSDADAEAAAAALRGAGYNTQILRRAPATS